MADTAATTTTNTVGNDNDDWEIAVDTGEFDKRLEQQEKARAANQEPVISSVSNTVNGDNNWNPSGIDLMKSNKPIRILKRPTSQTQLPTNNDTTKSLTILPNSSTTTTTNNTNNINSTSSTNNSCSSTTVPTVSIIPRIQTKDSTNSSQTVTNSNSSSSTTQPTRPPIKTYEQRELEYRLARLRIMGEEESSAKDDDDDNPSTTEPTSAPTTDDITKPSTSSPSSSTTRTTNNMSGLSQQPPLQCQSTPGSYASNLYALNNAPSNSGTIHFTPNNSNNNSTPNLGPGLFSSPNIPQNYRGAYPMPYSHMQPPTVGPRYPLTATTPNTGPYMTSTPPFISGPSSSISASYHYPPPPPQQQHSNMPTNNWYNYQHSQPSSGTQQFGYPQ